LQDWKMTDEIVGVEFAGLENDGLEHDGLENDGVENDEVEQEQTYILKATGNSRLGIPGNSRESRTPKIPGGNSREFLKF